MKARDETKREMCHTGSPRDCVNPSMKARYTKTNSALSSHNLDITAMSTVSRLSFIQPRYTSYETIESDKGNDRTEKEKRWPPGAEPSYSSSTTFMGPCEIHILTLTFPRLRSEHTNSHAQMTNVHTLQKIWLCHWSNWRASKTLKQTTRSMKAGRTESALCWLSSLTSELATIMVHTRAHCPLTFSAGRLSRGIPMRRVIGINYLRRKT